MCYSARQNLLKEGAASTYGLTDGSAETVGLVCSVERTEGELAVFTVVNLIARVRPAKVPCGAVAISLSASCHHVCPLAQVQREKKKKRLRHCDAAESACDSASSMCESLYRRTKIQV